MIKLSKGRKQQVINKLEKVMIILGFDDPSGIVNNWRYGSAIEEKEWVVAWKLLYAKRRKSKFEIGGKKL